MRPTSLSLLPCYFLFGSDGNREAFAFDARSDACEMVRVPFMDLELVTPLARDFEEFLSVLFAS